jgi:hypothetical protein
MKEYLCKIIPNALPYSRTMCLMIPYRISLIELTSLKPQPLAIHAWRTMIARTQVAAGKKIHQEQRSPTLKAFAVNAHSFKEYCLPTTN